MVDPNQCGREGGEKKGRAGIQFSLGMICFSDSISFPGTHTKIDALSLAAAGKKQCHPVAYISA